MRGFTNLLHSRFFFSSFTFLTFFSSTSLSVDTLTSTQYLTINQTLVSEKEIFELGFFSSSNSRWYLGIWYKHIPGRKVVWVANRDKPLKNSSGILRIGDRGNIVLLDQYGSFTWSSNQTAARNPVSQILDSGNLIIKEQNETDPSNHLWQTFSDPTDTLLPGIKLGWNFHTNTKRYMFLSGFRLKNQQAWNFKGRFDGCVRNTDLDCGSDKFVHLLDVKLPDTTSVFAEKSMMNLAECACLCTKNCSCTAYANVEILNGQGGCVMWSDELTDIKQYSAGGQDLYLRLAASDVDDATADRKADKNKNKIKKTTVIISISVTIGTIILAARAYFLWTLAAKSKDQNERMIEEMKEVNLNEVPLLKFEKVAAATDNFHSSNKLGEGGYGPVYKGELQDGQKIAVKRLSSASRQGLQEFMNEVLVISKLQHRNLVRLLGCCVERGEKMLIYELMPNKSLDAIIFDSQKAIVLDWRTRFNIILGITRGLLYLHRDSRLKIIHRDLKASNILLDEELNPKISDFGTAKIFGGYQEEANTERIVGTYGYMSPEYAMEGLFSEKSDIFSFGVLLLEIVSGRKNTSFYQHESLSLVQLAWKLWNEDKIISLIDPDIYDEGCHKDIVRCIHVGLLCVQELARCRPTTATVTSMLNSEVANLPKPGQVAFAEGQTILNIESSQNSIGLYSINNVTITNFNGR